MRHLTLSELLRPWAFNGVTHLLVGPRASASEELSQAGLGSFVGEGKTNEISSAAKTYARKALDGPETAPFVKGASTEHKASAGHETSAEYAAGPYVSGTEAAGVKSASQKGFTQGASRKNLPEQSPSGHVSAKHAALEQNARDTTFSSEIPRDQWPAEWEALFRKTRKAPVVWTYSNLGLDLSGRGLPARSACLRTIIGRLGFPKGSSSFWPSSLPDAKGVLQPDPAIFFSALLLLAPKVVIVAGEGMITSKVLPLALYTPFTQQVHQGRLYVLLPGFSRMIDDSSLVDRACSYLRAALSSLVSLQKP